MSDRSFEAWVDHVFDHDLREVAWYVERDAPQWSGSTIDSIRVPLPVVDAAWMAAPLEPFQGDNQHAR